MKASVEIVVGQFEDVNARDFEAVMDAYTDDVTLALHAVELGAPGAGTAKTLTGKAAVGEWFGDWFRQFADYGFEIKEARSSGDRVFVVALHRGRGRRSDVPVMQRCSYVYTVSGGKVSRVELWFDRDAAIAAFGGRPSDATPGARSS